MFALPDHYIDQLETPCVVIDERVARENIARMQRKVEEAHCKLRPHIKTHKIPYFAKLQLEAGASGICSCKISEAEVMADAGIDDIFLAYPLVGKPKILRAILLSQKIKRLILAVDSIEQAAALNEAAQKAGVVLEVRMEVDTGAKRTGVTASDRIALAKALQTMDHLKVTGIYTFKSLVYHGEPTEDNRAAGQEEGEMLRQIAQEMKEIGYEHLEISGGSTPTGLYVAESGAVDEVRPGTYIFNDYMLTKEKAATPDQVAVRLFATVVSVPSPEYAVIDGGTKTFPMDIMLDQAPYYYTSYAMVQGREDLQLRRMNEEHGILTSTTGKVNLKVGQVLELMPIHVCTAINMQNNVYIYDGHSLRKERVAARGMLF